MRSQIGLTFRCRYAHQMWPAIFDGLSIPHNSSHWSLWLEDLLSTECSKRRWLNNPLNHVLLFLPKLNCRRICSQIEPSISGGWCCGDIFLTFVYVAPHTLMHIPTIGYNVGNALYEWATCCDTRVYCVFMLYLGVATCDDVDMLCRTKLTTSTRRLSTSLKDIERWAALLQISLPNEIDFMGFLGRLAFAQVQINGNQAIQIGFKSWVNVW